MRNLYDILAVAKDATQDAIKKAHRALVKKHHPDKGGDEQTFKEIQRAYDVLGNEDRRKHYDATGEEEPKRDSFHEQFAMFVNHVIIPKLEESKDTNVDIITIGTNELEDCVEKAESAIDEIEKHIKKLTPAVDKIKRKNEGANLIQMILEDKISKHHKKLAQVKEEKEFFERALEEMENYTYDYDPDAVEEQPKSALEMLLDASRSRRRSNGWQ